MSIIKKDGIAIAVVTSPSDFFAQLEQDGLPTDGYTVEYSRAEQKLLLRSEIYTNVADLGSLVGTAADAAQVLVLFACADAVALAQAKDFASYKKSRMDALAALSGGEAGDANLAEQAGKLLADVASGAVIMPFQVKPDGASGVFADVAKRATGVAKVMTQAQPATA